MRDLERVIDIADERGVQLRTVTAGDLDLGTPAGRMLARILGSVARQEVEHKGERQRRANEQRRAAGKWVRTGLRKFGYTHDGNRTSRKHPHCGRPPQDVLAGKSLRGIAIAWNERGLELPAGNKFTSMQVRRTLINPLYAGLVTHREKVVGRGELAAHHRRGHPSRPSGLPVRSGAAARGVVREAAHAFRCGHAAETVVRRSTPCIPAARSVASSTLADRPATSPASAHCSTNMWKRLYWHGFRNLRRVNGWPLLNGGRDVDVKALQAQRDALQAPHGQTGAYAHRR